MLKPLWNKTLKLWSFGVFKVPMIFWLRPTVLVLDDRQAVIKVTLKRRSKNHLNSMYLGALCVGADIAAGIHMLHFMKDSLSKFSFAFKDLHAEFLRRPESDVYFASEEGELIQHTINQALQSKAREQAKIPVVATTPLISGPDPVARFTLTLSIKPRL